MSDFLTSEQRQSYRENGYLFPVELMSAEEADQHRARLESAESSHGPMHYRVKPYLLFGSAFEIATHPKLLDAIECVLGPDILLWDSGYVIKEPYSDGFVSWHQDLTYWGLDMQSDYDLVSAWVAITHATPANGCMQFARASHNNGTFAHADTFDASNILHRGQTIDDEFEDSDIDLVELRAGQASLHQGWAVHSSKPNTSGERRIGLVMNYLKPSARQVVGDYEAATLVRGDDKFGYYAQEPICEHDFAPENCKFQLNIERKKREVYDNA